MPIRYEDKRVGWFNTEKINYSSDALKSEKFSIIRRWRLEPSDIDAYKKGDLVEPIKQIVYYLDPATPIKWRKYFKMGIEDWNTAFEKAGFINAVQVKVQPDTADWDAGDIRYNVLRWTSSPNPPWGGYGPSFVNPKTGEILGADIMLEWSYITNLSLIHI